MRHQERGVYLVLMAFILVVVFSLCALVVGLGFVATSKVQLRNLANLVSLAAIQGFVESDPSNAYSVRAAAGLSRANGIMAQNQRLLGVSSNLASLTQADTPADPAASGVIRWGMWYPEDPGSDPCGGPARYPCFVENTPFPGTHTDANAVRVELRTQAVNFLNAPFANFVGQGPFTVQESTVATLVQRCVAYLFDVTPTTMYGTHEDFGKDYSYTPTTTPLFTITAGRRHGKAVLKTQNTTHSGAKSCSVLADYDPVFSGSTPTGANNKELVEWCNMPANRFGSLLDLPHKHYRSDYREHPLESGGTLMVDSLLVGGQYYGPEPYTSFMLAFNTGLRAMRIVRSGVDRFMISGFNDQLINPLPASGTLTNVDFGIQLTNLNNRGLIDQNGVDLAGFERRLPNAISKGWYPGSRPAGSLSRTNATKAIVHGINALASCPSSSRKIVVIATDGVPNCWNPGINVSTATITLPATAKCLTNYPENEYSNLFRPAKDELLNTLLPKLKELRIAVTPVLDGPGLEYHFLNRWSGSPLHPIDPLEAGRLGWGGFLIPNSRPQDRYFNLTNYLSATLPPYDSTQYSLFASQYCTSIPPASGETCADRFVYFWRNRNPLAAKFREPSGLWGDMAFQTGGVYCPLLPKCNEPGIGLPPPFGNSAVSYYNTIDPRDDPASPVMPKLLDSIYRTEGTMQPCAISDRTKSEQAVECVLESIGANPYQVVEEEN